MIHWSVYLVRQVRGLNLEPVGVSSWEGVSVDFGRQGRLLISLKVYTPVGVSDLCVRSMCRLSLTLVGVSRWEVVSLEFGRWENIDRLESINP